MLVVIMGMLIFSGLAYVSEKDEKNTEFISMPQVRCVGMEHSHWSRFIQILCSDWLRSWYCFASSLLS